jgi:hypothetical protein
VLRLRGSNRVDWKTDRLRDISTKSIVTPPDERSGPPVHITYSLCDRGVRLKKYFLFPVMCHEQPESMSNVSSRHLSITYIRREMVDGSVLGLVR